MYELAAVYPYSTLKGTPTCSNHSGTALYENYAAGQRNLDVYALLVFFMAISKSDACDGYLMCIIVVSQAIVNLY